MPKRSCPAPRFLSCPDSIPALPAFPFLTIIAKGMRAARAGLYRGGLKFAPLLLALAAVSSMSMAAPPNVVIIFTDDMGYGDLGCYGSPTNRTPHLDTLAKEGLRSERFYVAQPVCSASRAALLTGCYPNRLGIHGALGPNSKTGLDPSETTLAELMKQQGYATAMVGKWHVGDHPSMLPTRQGFDHYFGLLYSNDMWPYHPRTKKFPPLPLFEDDRVKIAEVKAEDQKQLTTWYTERAVAFIRANQDKPFFLYLAHSMPHVPLYTQGNEESAAGLYADVMAEIDASVGEISKGLEEAGDTRNTLVIFTSDNGPWLSYGTHSGTAGPLREGKGAVWEGGVRVPFIARWPGKIPAGVVSREPMMTIDLLPTLAGVIGAKLPSRPIDGLDVLPILTARPGAKNPHAAYYFYYRQNELQAVLSGDWKLYLPHRYQTMDGRPGGKGGLPEPYSQRTLERPELYNVASDIGETTDVASAHPAVVEKLLALAEKARDELGDSLVQRRGSGTRGPGKAEW